VELALKQASAGDLNVSAVVERWKVQNAPRKRTSLRPARRPDLPQVVCDNEASPASTLVEVHAVDEAGLAYQIASVLADLGLEIVCARIATERSDALDVFYVTNGDGTKLSEAMNRTLVEGITARLKGTESVSVGGDTPKLTGRQADEKSRGRYQATLA
jgi:UTP:GlnB (protein PII) uridylyltransferase